MALKGPAKLLSIYVTETDKWHHEPVYLALLDRARAAGLAGATLLHGAGGFGVHRRPHATLNEALMASLPVVIQVVDSGEAIAAFLPTVREMVPEGLVTLSDVEVL